MRPFKVDESFTERVSLARVGPLGTLLWLAGAAYCYRNQTGDFIPWGIAQGLVTWQFYDGASDGASDPAVLYVGSSNRVTEDDAVTSEYVIDLLLAAGLWAEVKGLGYRSIEPSDWLAV